MSNLIFLDSFDHYASSQGARKWNNSPGITSAGRTGQGGTTGAGIAKTLNQSYSSLTIGVAVKFGDYSGIPIQFHYLEGAASSLFWLVHNDDGRFYFRWAQTGSDLTSPVTSFVVATGQWYYFEMQATVTPGPPGHVDASLRINGGEVLAWSTSVAAGTGLPFNRIELWLFGTIDDLYLTDDEFLGDVRIGVLYPNAAGDSTAWTPNGAGANWEKVKEHPTVDDDTTYNSAATVALKDLYNLDNIDPAFTGTIKGVQALWCVKKSDEGAGAVKGVWKSGSTEIEQADGHNYLAPNGFHPSATSYLYNIQPKRVSLFTSTDWTKTEIDALQLGITRTV